MDYKGQADLMRRDAEEFDGPGYIIGDLRNAAQSITDLLARAEAAEKREAELRELLAVVNNLKKYYPAGQEFSVVTKELSDQLWDRVKNAEARAEKAEALISWIYNEATISVEHNMRQYLDWLKDKIEEYHGQKEE